MARVTERVSGPSGSRVSALALGSWHTWDRVEQDEVVQVLHTATDAGVTLFDVGMYMLDPEEGTFSHTDLAFAAGMREAGIPRDSYRLAGKAWLPDTGHTVPRITDQVNTLLARQETDHLDFVVLGDLMNPTTDYSSILDEIEEVTTSGKALNWAVNNWSAAEVQDITDQALAGGLRGPDYAQLKYGVTRRSVPEGGPFTELCARTGLTVQASDTFEGGLLLGSTTSRMIGGDIGGTQAKVRASVENLREAAASLGATVAQLAIAFPLTNPHTSSVLIGSRTLSQTIENLGAFDLLERHSADEIRAVAEEFWFDRSVVDPASSWGTTPDDDPSTYRVVTR